MLVGNNNFKKLLTFNNIGYLLLLLYLFLLTLKINSSTDLLTDADISSNILYGKLLLENKKLVLDNWYYSTFVDIINIDKIFAILFLFFDSWKSVHVAGILIINIIMFGSFYYVCKQLGIKNISWLSLILLGSFSYDYYRYIVYFNIYSVYLIFSFLILGLIIDITKNEKHKKIKYLLLLIVSFSSCTSGIRNLTTLAVPFVAALVVIIIANKFKVTSMDKILVKKLSYAIICCFVFSIIGYLFNSKILNSLVGFNNYSVGITSEPLNNFIVLFKKVLISGWIGLFGVDGINIKSIVCLSYLIITIGISLYIIIRKRNDLYSCFLLLFFVFSACATSVVFFISTTNFEPRYLLQPYSLCILIFGLGLNEIKNIKITALISIILACLSCYFSFYYINQEVNRSTNNELIEISNYLTENEIYQGYASYWNANILSEFSDGKIEVWSYWLENRLENAFDDTDLIEKDGIGGEYLNEWLQLKSHFHSKPEEPFFFVINNNFLDMFSNDVSKYTVKAFNNRTLLVFTSYQQFKEIFEK